MEDPRVIVIEKKAKKFYGTVGLNAKMLCQLEEVGVDFRRFVDLHFL